MITGIAIRARVAAVDLPPLPLARVTEPACFQTRLLLAPTVARGRCFPRSASLEVKTAPFETWSFLTVLQREPCWRWIRSLPLSGALPQARRVRALTRSATKGNRKAVRDGFGRPSLK